MKKNLKIVLSIIVLMALFLIIDLICIFTLNRPLFAIRTENNGSLNKVYKGLLYDTYNCAEYSTPQIKLKGSKFSCAIDRVDVGKVIKIVDTTKNKISFACAEVLEQFYEDDENKYYFNCMKGKYIIVKYESGYEETVKNALKYGTITISDLDKYNIEYIIEKKDNFIAYIDTIETINCDNKPKIYYSENGVNIYT